MTTPPPRRPEPSLRTLETRIRALEARLADFEGPYVEEQYRTRREITGVRVTLNRMATSPASSSPRTRRSTPPWTRTADRCRGLDDAAIRAGRKGRTETLNGSDNAQPML